MQRHGLEELESTTMGIPQGTKLGREQRESLVALESLVTSWSMSCEMDTGATDRPFKTVLEASLKTWQELLYSGNFVRYGKVRKEIQRKQSCLAMSGSVEEHFKATLSFEWDALHRLQIQARFSEFRELRNLLDAWMSAMKVSLYRWRRREVGKSLSKVLDGVIGCFFSAVCVADFGFRCWRVSARSRHGSGFRGLLRRSGSATKESITLWID